MSRSSVKNDEEALFINKKRHQYKWHICRGCKGYAEKLRGHQQEGSLQTEGVQRNRNDAGQYMPKKKFEGNCYNLKKRTI